MPFVRISIPVATPHAARRRIPDGIHRALVRAIGIPEADRFQLVATYEPEDGIFDPAYLGIARRHVVAIEITLVRGRTSDMKRALYRHITEELVAAGVRREDVLITLTENDRADWSVGNGEAQLLDTVASATARTAAAVAPSDGLSAEEMWAPTEDQPRAASEN
jgi:phenylpyruvate tautomerase PptA (4-oxalocrotonate tautomerase family)